MSRKVIITCALTGSSHTPTMSPHLPYSVEQIIRQGVDAARAGAAILHLHARDPDNGKPSSADELFLEYYRGISADTDVIISISTGGGVGMSIEERLAPVKKLQPELCTLNLGTMNYGLFPLTEKYRGRWRFDWEEPYLEKSRRSPFVCTYADIEYMLRVIGPETGAKFECEAYDVSHLYTLAYYADRGWVEPPLFIQMILGTMGGIGPDVSHLVHMKETADKLFGHDYQWSVLAAGRHQFGLVTTGAVMGSHVRVGLEDSLYLEKGVLAESNASQVERIRKILEALSLDIASPDEARTLLGLKGKGKVVM